MLGIALILVGIVLVHNGVMFLSKSKQTETLENGEIKTTIVPLVVKSPKSIAFFNAIVGAVLLILNIVAFAFHRGQPIEGFQFYQNIAAGFLFGITYLFVAGNLLFKLDMRPFGWFSAGVCVFAAVMAGVNIHAVATNGFSEASDALWLALLWISWFFVWLLGALEFILGVKKAGKIFPYASIVVGVIGAFVPALLMVTGAWGLLG